MNARLGPATWIRASVLLALILSINVRTHASVVIAGTRVIYDAQESEVTLRLNNKGSTPGLVQVWIDKGEEQVAPTSIEVPFTVAPPISRIDPGKAQTLRIFYTGEPLPQDVESVFWLNVLEIPPEPGKRIPGQNYLQMSVLSRIKLFFRPKGLPGDPGSAPAQLSWRLVRSDAGYTLEVRNPTTYHVSFAGLSVASGDTHASFDQGGMVDPRGAARFPLRGTISPGGEVRLHYRAINDFGGVVEGDAAVSVAATPDQ
jgi:P pilus assembly chaperone PapD